jgi:hypothetical protein
VVIENQRQENTEERKPCHGPTKTERARTIRRGRTGRIRPPLGFIPGASKTKRCQMPGDKENDATSAAEENGRNWSTTEGAEREQRC